jgi:hypothetical protein
MHSLLQHEAERIERKLGGQDTRTKNLKAGLQTNTRIANALKLEGELSRIDVPEIAEKGALIHGRIVDEDDLGIDRLTVYLVDRSGALTRDTPEPTTDASGYFAIPLEPETVDRLIKQHPDGIFLAVVTPRRRTVYQQRKPLALAQGSRLLAEDVRLKRADLISVPSPPSTTLAVPNLVGITEKEALATLQKVGLQVGKRETKEAPDQVGRVLTQSPAPGVKLAPGSSVSLVIGTAGARVVKRAEAGRPHAKAGKGQDH